MKGKPMKQGLFSRYPFVLIRQIPLYLLAGLLVYLLWFVFGIERGRSVPILAMGTWSGIPFSVLNDALVAAIFMAVINAWYNIPSIKEYDNPFLYVLTVSITAWLGFLVAGIGSFLWYHSSVTDLSSLFAYTAFGLMLCILRESVARKCIVFITYTISFSCTVLIFHAFSNHWMFPLVYILFFIALGGFYKFKENR
jgi:hypothetical protein